MLTVERRLGALGPADAKGHYNSPILQVLGADYPVAIPTIMASYDQAPQDEGYSEDPLTFGTVSGSTNMQNWILSLPLAERTGKVSQHCEGQTHPS
jgi:hypothetical protein